MDRLARGESADVSGGPSSRGKGRPGANSFEPEVARQGQAATRHQSEATPCHRDVIGPLDRHDTFEQRRLSDPTRSRQGPSVPNVLRLPWRGRRGRPVPAGPGPGQSCHVIAGDAGQGK